MVEIVLGGAMQHLVHREALAANHGVECFRHHVPDRIHQSLEAREGYTPR